MDAFKISELIKKEVVSYTQSWTCYRLTEKQNHADFTIPEHC